MHAYLLLGDPEWLVQSVRSYYDHVERIVACYDVDHVGWNGYPMRTKTCLDLLASLDVDGKVEYLGGHYADPGAAKYEAETRQRQRHSTLPARTPDGCSSSTRTRSCLTGTRSAPGFVARKRRA